MAQTYDLNTLIPTSTSVQFEKRLENELVLGKMAKTQLESGAKKGDEINIIMPARVTMTKWDGGDLNDVENIKSSIVKVPIDQGYQVNFELEEAKELQIVSETDSTKATKLIDEFSSDAMYSARDKVDSYIGSLYALAGHVETNSGNAIQLTTSGADKCYTLLANMKSKFSRANAWKNDKMITCLPPEMIAIMLGMPFMQYTEMQVKDKVLGEISKKAGWRIFESNNIAQTGDATITHYPLFGIEGETVAAPLQKGIKLIPYIRDKSVNKAFKGTFIFGGSVPNAKKLGTAKVQITPGTYD